MRLLDVYIKKYKNIIDKSFDFSGNDGYIALIGLNGSGKSNFLEALSLIFDELSSIPTTSSVGGFRVSYKIDDKYYHYETVDSKGLSVNLPKTIVVPSSIIACYSGEDLRLWHLGYESYYMSFFGSAIQGNDYIPQIIYINKYCWKIAFISLLFSMNRETQDYVKNTLHIDIDDVQIQFIYNNTVKAQAHDASVWLNEVKNKYGTNYFRLSDLRDWGLGNSKYTNMTEDFLVFFYLYLLYMPKKSKDQPVDRLINDIKIQISGVDFDNISEGEKKMILIGCITCILGDNNSLLLFDEPDAHVHIEFKKNMLDIIRRFKGQTVFTTHSPFFLNPHVNNIANENIYFLHNGEIEKSNKLEQIYKLSNGEINYFEGAFILSSKKILITEGKYDGKYLRRAIDIFSHKDIKYSKLNKVAIMQAGGASNAVALYEETLKSLLPQIDKLVFLFDYDRGGYKEGWEKIDKTKGTDGKVVPLFYQHNYISINTQEPKPIDTIMVEDFFSENAYATIVAKVHVNKHKEFRNIQWDNGVKGTANAIKNHIEKNYPSFKDEWYNAFQPVLDKLLEVFDLN